MTQTERVAATPQVETVRKSSRTPARGTTPSTKQVIPSSSVKKTTTGKKKGGARATAAAPKPPSPEEIARQGGLYFDMDGRPVFVEMKPAAFYGDALMRPYIKLDENGKPLQNRPFQPKLPNEPLLEWGKSVKWDKGGLRAPPINSTQAALLKQAQGLREPQPLKPRAAWQFYAEELIQKNTNARDRFEGDDQAVRQLIINEVHGSHKKKHQWTVSYHDNEVEGANKGGKWAQLNAVEQEKYIKMHNEDVRRYDQQMEEWHRQYPEEQSKAVEQSMKRIAARREQAEHEAKLEQLRQQKEQQQQQTEQQQQQQQQQGQEQQQQQGEQQQQGVEEQVQEGSKGNSSGGGSKGLSSGTKRGRDNSSAKRQGGIVGTGKAQRKAGRKQRRVVGEEEEAAEGLSDEEDEAYQSERSEDEDYVDAQSELEEADEEQQPPKKQKKSSSPPRKVLANADSKLNSPTKPAKATSAKLTSPTRTSLSKGGVVGGVKKTPSRASTRAQ